MSSPALRDEILEVAQQIAGEQPRVAVLLLEIVAEGDLAAAQAADIRERRRLLRLLRAQCFASVSDTEAARMIADDWAVWEASSTPPTPGSPEDYFSRLWRAGFRRPLRYRQILVDIRS